MKRLLNKFKGEVCICGTGPSRGKRLRDGKPCIFLNDAIPPWPSSKSFHLFTDGGIWSKHYSGFDKRWGSHTVITRQRIVDRFIPWAFGFTPTNFNKLPDIKISDSLIFTCTTVAASALMVARKLGFTRVWLYGVDYSSPWIDTRNWPKMKKHLDACVDWFYANGGESVIQTNPNSLFQPNTTEKP